MKSEEVVRYRRTSLGGGLTFVPIDTLYAEFKAAGVTYNSFRQFLKNLDVPVLHIGKQQLVRVQSFRLALLKISRIGEKDFLAPGCPAIKRNNKVIINNSVRHLDVESYKRDMELLIAELLFCKAASGVVLTQEVHQLASQTVERMLKAALQGASLRTQALYDRENVKRMKTAAGDLPYSLIREHNSDEPTDQPDEEADGSGD